MVGTLIYKYITSVDEIYSRDINSTFPYIITNWNDMTYDLYMDDLFRHWFVYLKDGNGEKWIDYIEHVEHFNSDHRFVIHFVDKLYPKIVADMNHELDFKLIRRDETKETIQLEEWSFTHQSES